MTAVLKDIARKLGLTIVDLMTSKKALATAAGVIVGLFVKDADARNKIVEGIMVYVASQGIVDHAKAKAAAVLGAAQTSVTNVAVTP